MTQAGSCVVAKPKQPCAAPPVQIQYAPLRVVPQCMARRLVALEYRAPPFVERLSVVKAKVADCVAQDGRTTARPDKGTAPAKAPSA